MSESTTTNSTGFWVRWIGGLMIAIVAGAAAWGALFPDNAARLVAVEVRNQDSLAHGRPGEINQIPIRVTNHSNRPIRIVGNNAC